MKNVFKHDKPDSILTTWLKSRLFSKKKKLNFIRGGGGLFWQNKDFIICHVIVSDAY